MKKVLALLLTVAFITVIAVPAFAAPQGVGKGVQAKVHVQKYEKFKFKDVFKGHWAEAAIMKMFLKGTIKGYPDGCYRPSNVVTKAEAVVMLVNDLGLTADVDDVDLSKFKHAKQIPVWAQEEVKIAYELGILTKEDLKSFRPNQGAKRIFVAAMITRALELDEDATMEALNFKDVNDIPSDLIGVVRLMVKSGIMKGTPGNCFLPNKPITRAEMAVLLGRVDDDKKGYIGLKKVSGTFIEVDDGEIIIERNGAEREFELADRVKVYLVGEDGEDKISLKELEEGYHVKLTFNEDGEVYIIRASEPDEEKVELKEFKGEITDIDSDEIEIKKGKDTYSFAITKDTEIEIGDVDEPDWDDLQEGFQVVIEAEDDEEEAVTIKAIVKEYKGTIIDLDEDDDTMTIKTKTGREYTFNIEDAEIEIDDDDADLDDLLDEYEDDDELAVEITACGSIALQISVE
ncbi:MAG: S-layer homology domain-containing protein [Bacillota bacterium]